VPAHATKERIIITASVPDKTFFIHLPPFVDFYLIAPLTTA